MSQPSIAVFSTLLFGNILPVRNVVVVGGKQESWSVLVLIAAANVLQLSCFVLGDGAGRAFPIDAENFAIDNFQRVNPSIVCNYSVFTSCALLRLILVFFLSYFVFFMGSSSFVCMSCCCTCSFVMLWNYSQ